MPLCLAFEDNRPPVSSTYRRPPEQKNATDNVSAGVATREVTSLVAIPFAFVEIGHRIVATRLREASRCKHLVAKARPGVPHPGGYATTTNIAARTLCATPFPRGSIGDGRRPYDELATPMSPSARRRATDVWRSAAARPAPRSSRRRRRDCRCASTHGAMQSPVRVRSRRSPPSILSVGYGLQRSGFPSGRRRFSEARRGSLPVHECSLSEVVRHHAPVSPQEQDALQERNRASDDERPSMTSGARRGRRTSIRRTRCLTASREDAQQRSFPHA
jgi:hypothetical protein